MIRHGIAAAGVSFVCTFGTVVLADSELTETPIVDRSVGAELEAMQARIDALQAELDAQRKRLAELQSDRIVAQDARVSMTYNRPTIASADGRSSLALRSVVQADSARYSQDEPGPLAEDFRRGSVGSSSRENAAARDLSDGTYFRRARLGVEGTIDRDFGYRLMLELGGSGTEGPTRINDAWVSYTGFARSRFRPAPARRPPTWMTARLLKTASSSNERRAPTSTGVSLVPTVGRAFWCAAMARAG